MYSFAINLMDCYAFYSAEPIVYPDDFLYFSHRAGFLP